MRNCQIILSAVLFVCCLAGSAGAVLLNNPDYRSEVFTTYSNTSLGGTANGIAFDGEGNMYVPHTSGHIYKIAPNGSSTLFTSGAGTVYDIISTAGTAYGNYFYIVDSGSNLVKRVDMDGTISNFCTINSGPGALELDRVGNYGSRLYVGMDGGDRIDYVLSNGTRGNFSPFPYNNSGCVPGISFDPGSRYGGLMYVGIYSPYVDSYRGIYTIDGSGIATKFSTNLGWAAQLEFDTTENFGGGLYSIGAGELGGDKNLWQISENGTATLFAETSISMLGTFCFGPDGAMYITEFNYDNRTNTITRITPVPEPASMLLMAGGICLIRKKRF